MTRMTVTDLARNLRKVLDRVEYLGEEIVLLRNRRPIARIIKAPHRQTAPEAMADLYRTLPEAAGATWVTQSRASTTLAGDERNPWLT